MDTPSNDVASELQKPGAYIPGFSKDPVFSNEKLYGA
jgi:hypothetical protein